MSSLGEKYAVQTQQTSYHNNVPKDVEQKLDHINNVEASSKIVEGGSKVIEFNIKTSFDVISSILPIYAGLERFRKRHPPGKWIIDFFGYKMFLSGVPVKMVNDCITENSLLFPIICFYLYIALQRNIPPGILLPISLKN